MVGIIGYGYVGRAFYNFFKTHFKVFAYDKDISLRVKYPFLESDLNFIDSVSLVVICVPTNALNNGAVDMQNVHQALSAIKQEKLVLIKSSIPPLSTQELSLKYPHLKTTSINAEVCKYMENTFFATKIIFCNEFANICKTFGADYDSVRELWLKDPRITKTHTLIFDNENKQCFGGKCLPKDLSGIIMQSFKYGYKANFLESVQDSNSNLRSNAQKPHILCFHRIAYKEHVESIYFERKMAMGYLKLEEYIESYLSMGFEFGNITQCLQEPNKYFCLSFDDGFKEHLAIAKKLHENYTLPNDSLIFSINVYHTLRHAFCGMDLLYYLVEQGKIKDIFDYFKLTFTKQATLHNIAILKEHYVAQDSQQLIDFHQAFNVDLSHIFLDSMEVRALSNYGLIASHALIHRDLTQHKEESKKEIQESKAILEQIIQKEIDIFCYPEGKNDKELQEICKQIGFSFALSLAHESCNYCIGRRVANI